jgi:hypothetical protein
MPNLLIVKCVFATEFRDLDGTGTELEAFLASKPEIGNGGEKTTR